MPEVHSYNSVSPRIKYCISPSSRCVAQSSSVKRPFNNTVFTCFFSPPPIVCRILPCSCMILSQAVHCCVRPAWSVSRCLLSLPPRVVAAEAIFCVPWTSAAPWEGHDPSLLLLSRLLEFFVTRLLAPKKIIDYFQYFSHTRKLTF